MSVLIKGGTIVTAAESYPADLLIDDGRIALIGTSLDHEGAQVIDASGKLLLPGGIDVHTHLSLPFFSTVSADDFYTGHKAAAFGGTTSHIDFATQRKGETLRAALQRWHRKAEGKAVIDYGVHMSITDLRDDILKEIPSMVDEGVTSLKLFMSYVDVYMLDDGSIFRIMEQAAELGMVVLIHAENGHVIDHLIKKNVAADNLAPEFHARSHPAWAEAEATLRAVALAGLAGASLYVVHMTCAEAVDQLKYGRDRGLPVMGETCPQYLFFSEAELLRPDAAKWVFSPPVRTPRDNEYLWQALADGRLQSVGTDHCPFLYDGSMPLIYDGQPYQMPGKELGAGNFSMIPNGTHGIEERMLMLWSYGVREGRLTANRFVELTATNPAKIFGLYPQKGSITVGADADLVVWDPTTKKRVSWQTQHSRTDHNIYEGTELMGLPEKVFARGRLLVDGQEWLGLAGTGRFLQRRPFAPTV